MLKVHRRILLKNRVEVVKDLEPNDVLDYLFQENILTENDIEIVKSERTRRARAEILLDTLPRKGPKAFTKFCEALSSEAGSRHLSTLLSTDPENPDPVSKRSCNSKLINPAKGRWFIFGLS